MIGIGTIITWILGLAIVFANIFVESKKLSLIGWSLVVISGLVAVFSG